MQDTKLTISDAELEAIMNSSFFLLKRDVTQKILHLFGMLENELMKKVAGDSFFSTWEPAIKYKGKIFRGENYRFMPYLLLDCPRVFSSETVFAFRSMFLWGNEFSFTLHLQGRALEEIRPKMLEHISSLKRQNFFFCVNDTPWEYFFEEKNYASLDDLLSNKHDELKQLILSKEFIKLSRKLEPREYDQTISYGLETFEKLMHVLR